MRMAVPCAEDVDLLRGAAVDAQHFREALELVGEAQLPAACRKALGRRAVELFLLGGARWLRGRPLLRRARCG